MNFTMAIPCINVLFHFTQDCTIQDTFIAHACAIAPWILDVMSWVGRSLEMAPHSLLSLRMDPTRAAAVFKRNSQLWTLPLVLINHLIHPDTFVEDPMIPQLFPPTIVTLLRDEGGSHPLSSTDQLTTNQPEC